MDPLASQTASGDTPEPDQATNATSLPGPPTLTEVIPEKPATYGGLPVDAEAPFGRRVDGTPAKPRGPRPKATKEAEVETQTRERLASVTRPPPRASNVTPIDQAKAMRVDYASVGRTCATLWFGIGELILGPEWAPQPAVPPETRGEAYVISDAFESWARSKDVRAVDPTAALCLTLLGYAAARLTRPTIKGRLIGAWTWAKNRVVGMMPKPR